MKCNEVNGDIYKSDEIKATVTLYKSTCKLHIQGPESEKWLSTFLKLCTEIEQTEVKSVYSDALCSTPRHGSITVNSDMLCSPPRHGSITVNSDVLCSTPRHRSFTPEMIDLSLIETTSEIVMLRNENKFLKKRSFSL